MTRRSLVPAVPLRVRLALLTAGLVLAASAALMVIFLSGPVDVAMQVNTAQPCVETSTNSSPCLPTPPMTTERDVRSSPSNRTLTLGRMGAPALLGFAAVVFIATGATYWIAGLALRPLRRASTTARTITIDQLDTRLPVARAHDELYELSSTFNTVLDRLADGIARERRFISDASHELRTPLAIMRANLEVTEADKGASLQEYRNSVRTVERSLGRLERLVDNLLVLSTEHRLAGRTVVRLGPLLESVLEELEPVAAERSIRVSLEIPAPIDLSGNEVLLYRVFGNLLENAIAYNHEGGSVRISTRRDDEDVVVEVADTGIGIPADHLPHVFTRLWRGDASRSRSSGGAGLGLALVAEIVARHEGEVHAESSEGQGSTFVVRLPCLEAVDEQL